MTDTREFAGVLLLTDREYEVFKLLGQGLTTREIAAQHGHRVTTATIDTYCERMKCKLGVTKIRQLLRLAVRYDYMNLKRIALVTPAPKYRFVEQEEEAPIPVLPASRNGHSLLAERPKQPNL